MVSDKVKKTIPPLLAFAVFVFFTTAVGAEQITPLKPPDTSSPRATLQSFLTIMRESRALLEHDTYLDSPASQIRDEHLEERTEYLFDFRKVPVERVEDIANYYRPLMMEILDRIEVPPWAAIPDADTAKSENLSRWTIPQTEIVLIEIDEGPRQGQWVFSAETTMRLKEFYKRVKDLPYRSDAAMGSIGPYGGPYQRHMLLPEESLPDGWIRHLPAWAKAAFLENAIWKWLAFGLILLIGSGLFGFITVLSRRLDRKEDETALRLRWWRLLPPVAGAAFAHLSEGIIDEQINAVGVVDLVSETGLWIVALFFWAWAVIELGGIVSRMFMRFWYANTEGVHHYLVAIFIRVFSVVAASWIFIFGTERLGLSIMPLLAGLGIGGIAIALAIRPTLENFIGGIILFVDRPVRVGDLCRYSSPAGSQTGLIERIGLRSTRLRMYEDTLVTIPNAEFSQLQLENLSSREMTLMQVTLALRYETSADQLRYVLAELRKMLVGHPKVSPERLRVRFRGFGSSSIDVEIFAYTRTIDYPEYWAICEDINLRIMDVIKDAGTGFAFPSQTTYFTNDTGLDNGKSRSSENKVAKWRSDNNLPFPEIEENELLEITDTLDYPPSGSPFYHPKDHPSEPEQRLKATKPDTQSKGTSGWKWRRQDQL